ncbi:MAG: preprotein translocase subunit SecG [Acidobacteriota bacterium]
MSAFITTIHVIVCLVLIIAVLLQSGKSADLAGAFGGIGSQTVFGPRGAATILSKVTTICAILFMVTSMGLWILSAKGTKSVVRGEESGQAKPPVTETKQKEEKKEDESNLQPQSKTETEKQSQEEKK